MTAEIMARLLYLVNHCPGFMPTRDEWEEVQKLINALAEAQKSLNKDDT